MLSKAKAFLLFIVGVINFIPVIGIISAQKLSELYGIAVEDPNLEILLRHRALMFGLVGGYIIYSVFQPKLQKSAIVMGFISMLGFLFLAWQSGQFNELIRKLAYIDLVAIIFLLIATVLWLKKY